MTGADPAAYPTAADWIAEGPQDRHPELFEARTYTAAEINDIEAAMTAAGYPPGPEPEAG
jgi:hypothetical protein